MHIFILKESYAYFSLSFLFIQWNKFQWSPTTFHCLKLRCCRQAVMWHWLLGALRSVSFLQTISHPAKLGVTVRWCLSRAAPGLKYQTDCLHLPSVCAWIIARLYTSSDFGCIKLLLFSCTWAGSAEEVPVQEAKDYLQLWKQSVEERSSQSHPEEGSGRGEFRAACWKESVAFSCRS